MSPAATRTRTTSLAIGDTFVLYKRMLGTLPRSGAFLGGKTTWALGYAGHHAGLPLLPDRSRHAQPAVPQLRSAHGGAPLARRGEELLRQAPSAHERVDGGGSVSPSSCIGARAGGCVGAGPVVPVRWCELIAARRA